MCTENLHGEVVYKPHWNWPVNCNLFKKRNTKSKQHRLKCICKFYNYLTSNNLIINTTIITLQETYWFLSFLESINTMAGTMNCQMWLAPVQDCFLEITRSVFFKWIYMILFKITSVIEKIFLILYSYSWWFNDIMKHVLKNSTGLGITNF